MGKDNSIGKVSMVFYGKRDILEDGNKEGSKMNFNWIPMMIRNGNEPYCLICCVKRQRHHTLEAAF